jgi:4-aminobutyrate aminotransferase-like enzyme
LGQFGHFVPFPAAAAALDDLAQRIRRLFMREKIGAILVEPVQTRGGINVPPPGFLPLLRRLCDESNSLLILDEIYTGFGRTGKWFACEHSRTVPDVACLGKALTGGFPLSACVGRADLMDAAWPESGGEAIHTSTFLGHPVGCRMALAQIEEIRRLRLVERGARLGGVLLEALEKEAGSQRAEVRGQRPEVRGRRSEVGGQRAVGTADCVAGGDALRNSELGTRNSVLIPRGLGLLAGLELRNPDGSPATAECLRVVKAMLRRGFILLPEGEHSNVISFTPPLTITEAQLRQTVKVLGKVLGCARVSRVAFGVSPEAIART